MKIEYKIGNKFSGFEFFDCKPGCIVTRCSPYDGETLNLVMDITQDQYNKWKDGQLIQLAFPHLTPDEREFILLTGLTPEQFDKLYAE